MPRFTLHLLVWLGLGLVLGGSSCPGLGPEAMLELADAGVSRYVGRFEPASEESVGGWTRFSYDTEAGEGPLCIDGSPFTVFHQARDPERLVVFLKGGGACWEGSSFCNREAEQTPPRERGIFADTFDDGGSGIPNPLASWSKLFVSYCDGSVFLGDNALEDANFPFGVRHHRGVRNLTAALDLAARLHPSASQVLLSGSSAGGFGVAGFAPSVFRFAFPAEAALYVFNDSGPALVDPLQLEDLQARANDWQFHRLFPASCTQCGPLAQPAEFLAWTLANDAGYRGALYSTDADTVIRTLLGNDLTKRQFRELLLSVHDPIHAAHPERYKRFIRSGSNAHTALGSNRFYTAEADGTPLYAWLDAFVNDAPGWIDIVEVSPAPAPSDLERMRQALGKARDGFDCLHADGSPGGSCAEFDLDGRLPVIGFPDLAVFRRK